MKFGFVTCVKLGLSCMEAIYEGGKSLELAITLTDDMAKNKSGRVYLDDFCHKHAIHLAKTTHINNSECIKLINDFDIDWLFIIGWSQIAGTEILNAPNKGVIGIHPTLLPEGRGRAAIPWAILKGLERTGVTMFKLDQGVDTGEIIAQELIPLSDKTDAFALYNAVNEKHISIIRDSIMALSNNDIELHIQDESKATYWPGRKPEDGEINLEGSVIEAEKLVRAVTKPYPGAFYFNRHGQKVIVWKARMISHAKAAENVIHFKDGALELLEYE